MKAVVFETLLAKHRPLALLYRLLGYNVFYLRRGRGAYAAWTRALRCFDIPSLVHLGSHEPREEAIAHLDQLWSSLGRQPLIDEATRIWGEPTIEDAFRKSLLFESVQAWRLKKEIEQTQAALSGSTLRFIPTQAADAARLLEFFPQMDRRSQGRRIFSPWLRVIAALTEAKCRFLWTGYLALQWIKLFYRLLYRVPAQAEVKTGVAVLSPHREWANGMDYLIDGEHLRREDVIFVPLIDLDEAQKRRFAQMNLRLAERNCPPRADELAKAFLQVVQTLLLAPITSAWVLECHARCLKELWLWRPFLRRYRLRDFVTYCDFMPAHIARNILLRRMSTRTVYVVDSINSGNVWDKEPGPSQHRHEFWCFLDYDLMVSWCPFYTRYQKSHPQRIGRYANVGTLWADQIFAVSCGRKDQPLASALRRAHGLRVIAAFDSSYHDHGASTYRDGIAFLEELLKLLREEPTLFIIFKEKNPRNLLGNFSFVPGELERMKKLFEELEREPRCHMPGQEAGAAACIAAAEVVVSYPFTSTTTLAWASGKKALYFDPTAKFGPCYFDALPGALARGYSELRARIQELLTRNALEHRLWLDRYTRDLEPFGDGRTQERLIALLTAPESASVRARELI